MRKGTHASHAHCLDSFAYASDRRDASSPAHALLDVTEQRLRVRADRGVGDADFTSKGRLPVDHACHLVVVDPVQRRGTVVSLER